MLTVTQKLIQHLHQEIKDIKYISACVYAILRQGAQADSKALFEHFVSLPLEFYSTCLLPIFEHWADEEMIARLAERYFREKELIEENYPEILALLAKLNFLPIKDILVKYALNNNPHCDYYLQKHAALGLLALDCSDIQGEILSSIEATYHKNLFPEFVPALVSKLSDKTQVLSRLFDTGKQYSSTDCNAGIILGFSLCGEEGRPLFEKVCRDPDWEADSLATSTGYYTYQGFKHLKIPLCSFYDQLLSIEDAAVQTYALKILLTAIELSLNALPGQTLDTFCTLHQHCFTAEESLQTLTKKLEVKKDIYALKRMIEMKMREELIFETL